MSLVNSTTTDAGQKTSHNVGSAADTKLLSTLLDPHTDRKKSLMKKVFVVFSF